MVRTRCERGEKTWYHRVLSPCFRRVLNVFSPQCVLILYSDRVLTCALTVVVSTYSHRVLTVFLLCCRRALPHSHHVRTQCTPSYHRCSHRLLMVLALCVSTCSLRVLTEFYTCFHRRRPVCAHCSHLCSHRRSQSKCSHRVLPAFSLRSHCLLAVFSPVLSPCSHRGLAVFVITVFLQCYRRVITVFAPYSHSVPTGIPVFSQYSRRLRAVFPPYSF